MKDRSLFLLTAYAIILVQLAISFGITYQGRKMESVISRIPNKWVLFGLLILVIVILTLVPMPLPLKFLVFTIFAIIIGLLLLKITYKFDIEFVNKALVGSILTFVVMSIIGYTLFKMGYSFAFLSAILFFVLIALIITGIVFMFVKVSKPVYKVYLCIIFITMAILTAHDTNVIMDKNYFGDVIDAALALYLNIINMFESLFNIEVLDMLMEGGKKQ